MDKNVWALYLQVQLAWHNMPQQHLVSQREKKMDIVLCQPLLSQVLLHHLLVVLVMPLLDLLEDLPPNPHFLFNLGGLGSGVLFQLLYVTGPQLIGDGHGHLLLEHQQLRCYSCGPVLQHPARSQDVTSHLPPPPSQTVAEEVPQCGFDGPVQALDQLVSPGVRSAYEPVLHPIASQVPIKLASILRPSVTAYHPREPIPSGDFLVEPYHGLMRVEHGELASLCPPHKGVACHYHADVTIRCGWLETHDSIHRPILEGGHSLLRGHEIGGLQEACQLFLPLWGP